MIAELLPEEKRRLHELEQKLLQLEKGSAHVHSSDIRMGLEEMLTRLDDLQDLVSNEPKSSRDNFKRRVQHLKTTFNHIKTSYETYLKKKSNSSFESQKQELFANAGENSRDLELELAENGSLSRSNRMMNDYIAVGQETFRELVSQRERLKGIQRKVFDILNYLGLANTIVKAVENREFVDRWIVFGGMLFIVLLLIFIWWYWRR
eukprot:gene4468-6318_t